MPPARSVRPVLPKRPGMPSPEMAVTLKPLAPPGEGLRLRDVGEAATVRRKPEGTTSIPRADTAPTPEGVAAPVVPNAEDETMTSSGSADAGPPPTPIVSTVPMPVGEPGPPLVSVEPEDALVGPGQQTQRMIQAPTLPVATDNHMPVGVQGPGPQPERQEKAMPVDAPGEPLKSMSSGEIPPFGTTAANAK